MNTYLNNLSYGYTENGAITHSTTGSGLYDMFAQCGAYRTKSDDECLNLFLRAYNENPTYALKCLFYSRDITGGQGERRYFRIVANWLAYSQPEVIRANLIHIPTFGRWDDLIYITYKTPLWNDAVTIIHGQLEKDMATMLSSDKGGISLLAKWMPSENASSKQTYEVANALRKSLHMTSKQYRKTLSKMRERINVLEKLMSAGRWTEIDFGSIPSRAGMIYKNAFARHDYQRYYEFMTSKNTKVNAKALYPYECIHQVFNMGYRLTEIEIAAVNKMWDNLADYINGATFNGIAVADVSGSMRGTPMEVAVSLAMYCAERAKGPFANHFITFSEHPQLQKIEGNNFYNKVKSIENADWGMNTDIEAVFNLLLNAAIASRCAQSEVPENVIIISDMQFDEAVEGYDPYSRRSIMVVSDPNALMDNIKRKWESYGYTMPKLIYWNVRASKNNFPSLGDNISYISGFSASIFNQLLTGKTGIELMYEVLDSERYEVIK